MPAGNRAGSNDDGRRPGLGCLRYADRKDVQDNGRRHRNAKRAGIRRVRRNRSQLVAPSGMDTRHLCGRLKLAMAKYGMADGEAEQQQAQHRACAVKDRRRAYP